MGVIKRNGNWWIDYFMRKQRRRKILPLKCVAELLLSDLL